MGRYLAIIQDSYREAIASRVLMMMIVVSLVTVVLFAGIGWWKVEKHSITLLEREGKIWLGLSARDDRDGVLLTATDNTGPAKDVPSGIGVYLTAIDGISLSKRDQLRDLSNNWKSGQKIELTVQIPWISIFSWELGDSSTELGLLNSIPTRVKISYIQSWIHSWIVNWLGVVAGLIVTAGFMPRFLESGGLHLVLARPVSRTGVIVARFIGGLSFMALFTSTLIFGLFLALGLRSGVWTPSALWAIPLMLFSFAQFYAVSCLCAIITRNTIVAIVVSVTFYFISMLFNFSNFIINAALTAGTSEAVAITADGQRVALLKMNHRGRGGPPRRTLTEYSLSNGQQTNIFNELTTGLRAVPRRGTRAWTTSRNGLREADLSTGSIQRDIGLSISGSPRLVETDPSGEAFLIASSGDLAVFEGNPITRNPWPQPRSLRTDPRGIPSLDEVAEADKLASALELGPSDALIGLSDGRVRRADRRDGRDKDLWTGAHKAAIRALAATPKGAISVDDSGLLCLWQHGNPQPLEQRRLGFEISAALHRDNILALGTRNGAILILTIDPNNEKPSAPKVLRGLSKEVLGIDISDDAKTIVASDAHALVTAWDLSSGSTLQTLDLEPSFRTFYRVFWWLYWLFPRTRQISDVSAALLLDENTSDEESNTLSPERSFNEVNYLKPLLSGAAFILIVVGLGSILFVRRDL